MRSVYVTCKRLRDTYIHYITVNAWGKIRWATVSASVYLYYYYTYFTVNTEGLEAEMG